MPLARSTTTIASLLMSHSRLARRLLARRSSGSGSAPLLPFLYATRSISHSAAVSSPPSSPPSSSSRPRPSPSNATRPSADEDVPFDLTPAAAEENQDPFAYLYTRPTPARLRPSQVRPPLAHPRPGREVSYSEYRSSSITQREREIFNKIFESILATPSRAARSASQPTATSADASPRSQHLPAPPALAELFTSTIGPQQSGSDLSFAPKQRASDREGGRAAMEYASKIAQYPPTLRAAAARAAGLQSWGAAESTLGSPELELLKKGLRACASDVAVLRWLETHAYTLPLEHSTPQAVFYSELLCEAMDIFANVYNDLGSVVAIFERAKKLGAESYVLGCTSAVYNRALVAVWDGFADLQRVRDLVEEMRVNAVGGDMGTVAVLRRVCRDVEAASDGKHGQLAAMMVGRQELLGIDVLHARATRLEKFGTLEKVEREDRRPPKAGGRSPFSKHRASPSGGSSGRRGGGGGEGGGGGGGGGGGRRGGGGGGSGSGRRPDRKEQQGQPAPSSSPSSPPSPSPPPPPPSPPPPPPPPQQTEQDGGQMHDQVQAGESMLSIRRQRFRQL